MDLAATEGLESLEFQRGLCLPPPRNVGLPLSHLLLGLGLLLPEVQFGHSSLGNM